MKFTFKTFSYIGILGTLLFTACSTSKTATQNNKAEKTQKVVKQKTVAWYKKADAFKIGKNSYVAMGISISTDSTIALNKARKQAKAQLQNGIQNDLESLRSDIATEEGNNSFVSKPRFIWMYRGVTNRSLKNVTISKTKVMPKNGIYQAYVLMKYSKKQVIDDMMNALSSVSRYQQKVKQSKAYQKWAAQSDTSNS